MALSFFAFDAMQISKKIKMFDFFILASRSFQFN